MFLAEQRSEELWESKLLLNGSNGSSNMDGMKSTVAIFWNASLPIWAGLSQLHLWAKETYVLNFIIIFLPYCPSNICPGWFLHSLSFFHLTPLQFSVWNLILRLRILADSPLGQRHNDGQWALLLTKLHHVEVFLVCQLLVSLLEAEREQEKDKTILKSLRLINITRKAVSFPVSGWSHFKSFLRKH